MYFTNVYIKCFQVVVERSSLTVTL